MTEYSYIFSLDALIKGELGLTPSCGAYFADGDERVWIHEEPAASSPKDAHPDWLKRVAVYRKYSKTALEEQCALNQVRVGQMLDQKPFAFGANYVIFSRIPEHTLVLEQAPVVAYSKPPAAEVWQQDVLSKYIWNKTFGELRKHEPNCLRGLRLNDKVQQPHSPPARWKTNENAAAIWRQEMMEYLLRQRLGRS